MKNKKLYGFRVDEKIMDEFQKETEKDGLTYSEVIRQLIAQYVKDRRDEK